jgi:hypothetical protein
MKILVAKTCAFACILGLSANTFVVAWQVDRRRAKRIRQRGSGRADR